jgi:FKBP-type peptidyl-prolyl cis-trans isomerase 2
MHQAQLGDRVRIQYSRVPKSGTTSTKPPAQKVLEFTVGGNKVMPGLSLGITGMAQGEQKHFSLQPADAYGDVKPRLIRQIPRHRLPKNLTLRVGMHLSAMDRSLGRRRRVRVVQIKPDSVLVDANHPLAGKVIELDVCLISLDSSTEANRSKPQIDAGGES